MCNSQSVYSMVSWCYFPGHPSSSKIVPGNAVYVRFYSQMSFEASQESDSYSNVNETMNFFVCFVKCCIHINDSHDV